MASKFKIWVDDSYLNNVQSYSDFEDDVYRINGFQGGQPVPSVRMNTALRQATLVSCAIMEIADSEGTRDFRSTITQVKNTILNWLENSAYVNHSNQSTDSTYAGKIGTSSAHPAIGADERPTYVDNDGNVTAGNFIPKLNGSKQTASASFYAPTGAGTGGDILQSSGTGAPQWVTPSSLTVGSATEASYASADHTKGTIEERLTRLGFRQGNVTAGGTGADDLVVTSSTLTRQGNFVLGKVSGTIKKGAGVSAKNYFTLPDGFYMKHERDYEIVSDYARDELYGSFVSGSQQEIEVIGGTPTMVNYPNNRINWSALGGSATTGTRVNFYIEFGYEAEPLS